MTDTQRCLVWWAPLDAIHERHADLLDRHERDRVGRARQPAGRLRSTLGAALLRLAVGDRLGMAPADVPVDRGCGACRRAHGRPTLPGTGLHTSVAHSGDWVAVALTGAGAVGVDVEQVTEVDVPALASSVLAEDEAAALTGFHDLFVYWTRKESVLKATGGGLAVRPPEVRVGTPGRPPQLLGYPGGPVPQAQMFDLSPGEPADSSHVAALTVLSAQPVSVDEFDGGKLLAST